MQDFSRGDGEYNYTAINFYLVDKLIWLPKVTIPFLKEW